MPTPVRYPGGVTNAPVRSALANMGQLDPTKFHTFFDDFDRYTAANWTVTNVGTPTVALAAGDGGILSITNGASDDNSSFHQNTVASFLLTAGKKTFFKARFKMSDATQSDFQLGLVVTDTTPFDATDGIYFMKDDGDAQLDFYCRKNATTGSTSQNNIYTIVNDTYLTIGFVYNGKDQVSAFVNDREVYTLDATSTYLPDTTLAVSFGAQNGEAVAKILSLDYIFAAQER